MDIYRLYIKDLNPKTLALLNLIRSYDAVELEEDSINVPDSQVKETRRRLDLIQKGEISKRSWDEAKDDLFNK